MKISTEPIENSQVALNVEMERAEVDEYLDKAYHRLVQKVSVPGFRKGKTPRDVLEHHIGKDALFQEALEQLVPKAYEEALEKQGIDAIAQPKIELVQTEPVMFKAIVPVRPTVKLGDYTQMRHESKPAKVGKKEIEATLEQVRQQHGVLVPVDRAVCFGDTVTINVEGERDGEPFPIRDGLVYEVVDGARLPLPGFVEELEGMEKGEERNFKLSYPLDYEMKELAGKNHSFKVTATEIKAKELPDLNDEFAKSLGSEDLTSLRKQIAGNLKARAEEMARLELERKVVDTAIDLSEMEYPPVLVDAEINRMLNEEARNFAEGVAGLENYLSSVNRTMEEHREELRPIATQRVLRSLVLDKIAEAENIEVDAAEIDAETEKMVKDADKQAEDVKKLFSLPQARESVRQFLVSRKTVERLVQIATASA
ncbi:MAG: trigger factor [Dehalococcoidia bacterium]|nr:trigger factor [Dehalococcoidia bacterium]